MQKVVDNKMFFLSFSNWFLKLLLLSDGKKEVKNSWFSFDYLKFTFVRVESEGMLDKDELARVSLLGCLCIVIAL